MYLEKRIPCKQAAFLNYISSRKTKIVIYRTKHRLFSTLHFLPKAYDIKVAFIYNVYGRKVLQEIGAFDLTNLTKVQAI